ncbi:MAG: hypothetical protein KTR16_10110 [Acidiferrobacterales bacterium]|nr:hypothetical protein [Acidiferrobacterales bacterium]
MAWDFFSLAGILVEYLDNSDVRLCNEIVYMDGRDFPQEYAMENRGNWPVSDVGYSIDNWQADSL